MRAVYKIAVISVVLGLVLAVLGMAMGGSNAVYVNRSGIHVLKNTGRTANAHKITELDLERFKSIDIEARYSDLEFIESDIYGIEIMYYDTEPSWSLSNGNLKIDVEQDSSHSFYLFNWNWRSANRNHVKVYIPKSAEFESVKVNTGSGDINVGCFYAYDIMLRCSSGNVDISRVEGDNIDVILSSGRFIGREIEAEKLYLKSSSGGVSFANVNAGSVTTEVISGSVSFDDCKIDELSVNSSSGRITSEKLYTEGMNLRATSGRIDLEGGFSGKSEINSSSGSVRITTSEDKESYSCDLSATSGRVTYDNERYDKRVNIGESRKNTLIIKATSGNIDVSF